MSTSNLWICVLVTEAGNRGPTVLNCGKIVANFGTVIAYDSIDWALWHVAGNFTTSGAIYRLDISDMTKQVVMFHCLEDAMEEVETRERTFRRNNTAE
jgi:hypothetical protein